MRLSPVKNSDILPMTKPILLRTVLGTATAYRIPNFMETVSEAFSGILIQVQTNNLGYHFPSPIRSPSRPDIFSFMSVIYPPHKAPGRPNALEFLLFD